MKIKIHFILENLRESEDRDEFHMTHTLIVMCGKAIGLELLCVEMDIKFLCLKTVYPKKIAIHNFN